MRAEVWFLNKLMVLQCHPESGSDKHLAHKRRKWEYVIQSQMNQSSPYIMTRQQVQVRAMFILFRNTKMKFDINMFP